MSVDDCVARAHAAVEEKNEDALFDYEDRLRRHGATQGHRIDLESRSGLAGTPSHVLEQRRKGVKVWLARRGLAPGEPDFAFWLRRRKVQQADAAPLMHLACHRHLRKKRDAIAMRDHLHDGSEARGAEARARLWRHQTAKRKRVVTQAMALLQQQEPLMHQHVGGLGALAFARAGCKHELVVEEMKSFDLRILDRKRNENEVEIPADQLSYQGFRDALAELQGEVGEAALQLGQCCRQQIGRD